MLKFDVVVVLPADTSCEIMKKRMLKNQQPPGDETGRFGYLPALWPSPRPVQSGTELNKIWFEAQKNRLYDGCEVADTRGISNITTKCHEVLRNIHCSNVEATMKRLQEGAAMECIHLEE